MSKKPLDPSFKLSSDWDEPEDLSERGKIAYMIVRAWANKYELTSGGNQVFQHPKENTSGYGEDSELVLIYDGGDMYSIFNCYGRPQQIVIQDELNEKLAQNGLFMEFNNHWSASIYPA